MLIFIARFRETLIRYFVMRFEAGKATLIRIVQFSNRVIQCKETPPVQIKSRNKHPRNQIALINPITIRIRLVHCRFVLCWKRGSFVYYCIRISVAHTRESNLKMYRGHVPNFEFDGTTTGFPFSASSLCVEMFFFVGYASIFV